MKPAAAPLQQATRTVPIVFAGSVDPVGRGLVASLARPGSNATGFMSNEFSLAGKWLELLKQIAPGPAVYYERSFVVAGGLISYGIRG